MENKDIEQLLQESADEVTIKNFSERWESIKDRINLSREVELKESTSETVLATSANSNLSQNSIKKNIIISVCTVFLLIAICLAIVLPLALNNNDKIYFNLLELKNVIVTENEFYDNLEQTDLEIVDLEKFETSSYVLLYTDDDKTVGGRFDVTDEDEGVFAAVVFYGTSVKSSFEVGKDYKTCTINCFHIEYKTEPDEDDLYSTKAQAVSINICYEFECLSFDENIESFFNKLLG